jgi:hypothetical protein
MKHHVRKRYNKKRESLEASMLLFFPTLSLGGVYSTPPDKLHHSKSGFQQQQKRTVQPNESQYRNSRPGRE